MDFVLLSCTKENLQLDNDSCMSFRLYSRPSPAPSWMRIGTYAVNAYIIHAGNATQHQRPDAA